MTGLLLLGAFVLVLAVIMLAANATDPHRPSRSEKKDMKELQKENLRLVRIINRLDGMAQNEYDASNNLFAHTVRQEILANRKEIA